MKKIFALVFGLIVFGGFGFAQEYIYFYGNGCPNCAQVNEFFEKNDVLDTFDVVEKEIYFNTANADELFSYLDKLGLDHTQVGVPFLVINKENECLYINGDQPIIDFFQEKIDQIDQQQCDGGEECPHLDCNQENCPHLNCESDTLAEGTTTPVGKNLGERLSFFAIMLPAAFADSINPCAFAVILLLLGGILSRTKNRKKAILAGLLFSVAVFISYLAMGIGLFSALATATNVFVIKLIVGILGIVVGLANFKDFFRYGKGFVMEVPFSWRPTMKAVIDKAVSPLGAFVVGFLVSMFLLPCTSGPYFTILGYLASESANLHFWGYVYLIVYNIIFILPMLIITGLIGFGVRSAEELAKIKHKHTKLIHLIVGFLMLGLGLYVLLTM